MPSWLQFETSAMENCNLALPGYEVYFQAYADEFIVIATDNTRDKARESNKRARKVGRIKLEEFEMFKSKINH